MLPFLRQPLLIAGVGLLRQLVPSLNQLPETVDQRSPKLLGTLFQRLGCMHLVDQGVALARELEKIFRQRPHVRTRQFIDDVGSGWAGLLVGRGSAFAPAGVTQRSRYAASQLFNLGSKSDGSGSGGSLIQKIQHAVQTLLAGLKECQFALGFSELRRDAAALACGRLLQPLFKGLDFILRLLD